jgi:hypothetical protein
VPQRDGCAGQRPLEVPLAYQCWVDTTANPSLYKIYDGASWITLGSINTTTHAWLPYLTGGVSGGVPYFSATNIMGSSAALAFNGFVVGGGAGAAPSSIAACTDDQIAFGRTSSSPLCRSVTGDITFATGVSAIGASKVTNSQLATMAANTTKCNATAGTANPTDCTGSTMRTNLGVVIGTNVEAWDADLDALAANSTDGFWAHTGAGTGAARTLTAPVAGLTITNPAGIAGNPTFALANDLAALEGLSSTGIARRTGTDAWSVGTLVTNAELATAADGTVKSNISGSTASPSDNTITAVLDKLGSTQGQILYRNATSWVPLTPGTAGQFLTTQGAAANPNWSSGGAGTGTVTSVATGAGLAGGPITASGTISIDYSQAFRNRIINNNFLIDIRNNGAALTLTTSNQYGPDRWLAARGTNVSTIKQTLTGGPTVAAGGSNIPSFLRVQRTNANTGVGAIQLGQIIESQNMVDLAGQAVVISFYARSGANYSPTSSLLNVQLRSGTTADQGNTNFLAGTWTGAATPINQSATLTTSWQRFSYTATLGTTALEAGIVFTMTPVGTAGAADYFDVTGVQVEYGAAATPVEQIAYGALVSRCLRYAWRPHLFGSSNNVLPGWGVKTSSTTLDLLMPYPVPMFKGPTLVTNSATFTNGAGPGAANSLGFFANTTSGYLTATGAVSYSLGNPGDSVAALFRATAATSWNGTGGETGNFYTGAALNLIFDAEL